MWCKRYAKVTLIVFAVVGIIVQLSTYKVLAKGEVIGSIQETTCETEEMEDADELYIEDEPMIIHEDIIVEIEDQVEEPEEAEVIVAETECYACTLSEAQVTATKGIPEDDYRAISFVEELEDGTRIYSFKGGEYTIPANHLERDPMIRDDGYIEKITDVPHYIQQSYPKTNYGGYGTVSSHGCGITSCAMVYSYLLDCEIRPDVLAKKYGRYNTEVGSAYSLFDDSAADFNLGVKKSYSWIEVEEGLKNGCVVIANVQGNTIFTDGGHFIVYYGITDDGKILIKDPSIYNYGQWSSNALKEGFKNGFDPKFCNYSFPCWIYYPKDVDAITDVDLST